MPRISSSVRSPTPVPASTSTSPSIRKDVVRQSLAIAPEQPSTRTFIQLRVPQSTLAHLVSKLVAPSQPGSNGSNLIEATRSEYSS
jgi:hypothetical protein